MISYSDFEKVGVRVGKIVSVEDFPEAKKPAYKLTIDFEEFGIKKSSAQCMNYSKNELVGRLVLAVVNFPPKQIGPFISEVLTLGVPGEDGKIVLTLLEERAKVGGRLY